MIILEIVMWSLGTLSMLSACIVTYIGDKSRGHQGTMEAIGFFVVAALLQIASRP